MNRVTVRIPTPLRAFSGQQSEIEIDAPSVGDALRGVVERYPELERFVFDADGGVRRFVNVYLDDNNVEDLDGLDSRTADETVVHIVPAVAGGRR